MENIDLTNLILNKETIISYLQNLVDIFNNFDGIVGDIPVSEQLGAALEHMASKEHTHENYATRNEVEELNKKVEMLIDLVGDVPVSEQIYNTINNMK